MTLISYKRFKITAIYSHFTDTFKVTEKCLTMFTPTRSMRFPVKITVDGMLVL